MISLADMLVVGNPPAKLWKALAVIADGLHPGFDLHSNITPGWSKQSCVLCSLTVRDFLRAVGFEDARVEPVCVVMFADENGQRLHSVGIGHPEDNRRRDDRWCGHLVVLCCGHLIDPTLYQAKRSQWPDLTGMMTVQIAPPEERDDRTAWGLSMLAACTLTDDERPGYSFDIGWLDNPKNITWRRGPDARDRARRIPVVRRLVERFGEWEDAA